MTFELMLGERQPLERGGIFVSFHKAPSSYL
ncbi:MAG: hypothetical protein RLZZ519_2582, partial [Bacteroidota bacterium]